MPEPIRVGVVGTSWWSDLMHLPSLTSHPQATVVAICGRTREPAEALAKKYGIPAVFSDYREMLAKGAMHALVVATPDDTHHQIAMAALKRGLHLLCEKPLARTLADAEAMASAADRAGVKHMTLFTWRWAPVFARLKNEIDNGTIGRPLAARLACMSDGAFEEGYHWWRDASRCNGALGDLGVHLIDLVRWSIGEIKSLSASLLTLVDHLEATANDTAALDIMTANGVHVSLDVSNAALIGDERNRMEMLVLGTKGSLEGRLIFFGGKAGARLLLGKADGAPRQVIHDEAFAPDAKPPGFLSVYSSESAGPRAFIDAILSDSPAVPDLFDGLAAQRVIDAAVRSHESGSRVFTA